MLRYEKYKNWKIAYVVMILITYENSVANLDNYQFVWI